ncbi:Bug family tripartite tricarboxylate transporter substrate binding protein [Marinivivus vitaminiproducens]|uniref:Bug family tripartite tricarboxylate transporter substrate binding protein n=1 Tax=Marinivivus vitaminiproducens TaxID=3035935 RepID=UPI00279DC6C6|nr:tripartite tricarboxylate transporter substrate-binding protein [Geminicoccaceae bacterium SCSIO 64248]
MPSIRRRTVIRLFAASVALATAWTAPWAQAEVQGLEITAPANPGSGYDQTSRAMQTVLQENGLASGVQVVNVPGAGGTVGLAQFATSRKRNPSLLMIGFTLLGNLATNEAAVTLDDVDPLALLLREYSVLVVPASSEIQSIDDLAARIKADTGAVSWGLGSAGGLDHIIAGQIVNAVGADVSALNAVNFAGGGEQVAAILGGHVTVAVGGLPEFASQIESGDLRVLAISSPERLEGSDIPTLREQGVDVALGTWRGVLAPKDMDEDDKAELAEAIAQMVKTDDWQAILDQRGWIDAYEDADGFGAFLDEQEALVDSSLRDLGMID